MSSAASSSSPSRPISANSLEDLRHRISLNEALLASLEGDDSEQSQLDKFRLKRILQSLIDRVQAQISIPSWGSTARMESNSGRSASVDLRPGSSNSAGWSAPTPNSDAGEMAPPEYLALPTRKRQRDFNENGEDDTQYPDLKSLRPSPAMSRAQSPAYSNDSFDFNFDDDPVMQALLGNNHREELQKSRKYMTELERKRQQEKEDEEFARTLQASLNDGPLPTISIPRTAHSNYQQAIFQPKGGAYHTMLPPPQPPARPIKPDYPSYPLTSMQNLQDPFMSDNPFTNRGKPKSGSFSDSDSDIEEINAMDFTPNFRHQSVNQNRANRYGVAPMPSNTPFAHTQNMPGSFPGFQGAAGSSVYGGASSLDLFGLIDQDQGNFGSTYRGYGGVPGSMRSPLDLDAYNTRLQDFYNDPTKTEEEIRELIKHIRPDEDLDPASREGTPEQMTFPLMEHQKLGLAWMKKMEEGTNKGGILADDMGLGKTIQALALIVSNPPPEGAHKPTLVIAPVALMEQWKREAEKMIKRRHALKVFILHGSARTTSWTILKRQDLILTTYGQLASELKRKMLWDEKVKMYPDVRPTNAEYCPLLGAESKFHRVIIDEAQWIKNKDTKSATAACFIQSKYRWCMTGTPMQNKVEELFSLIKFCRIKPYNDFTRFQRDFSRPLKSTSSNSKDKAMRQLQALLKAILLRRTKTSKIDGKPILTLPPKETKEARAVFSDDEAAFYTALQDNAQLAFNRYLKAGTVGRNYSNVLVLLLRLRQACCHPHLIKDFAINTGGGASVDLLQNARELPKEVVVRLKDMEAFECPVCMDAALNPLIFNPCGHALCDECLGKLAEAAAPEGGEPKCPHCRARVNTNKITDHSTFLRVYCPEREGVEPLEEDDSEDEDDDATGSDTDRDDDGDDDDDGDELKDFIVNDEEIEYSSGSDDGPESYRPGKNPFDRSEIGKSAGSSSSKKKDKKPKKSAKSKGKRKEKDNHKSLAQLRKDGLKSKAAKKKYLRRLQKDWQTSAKIEKTLELLEQIHGRGEGEKTIIFSAFTSLLDLLEVPLHRHPDLSHYARYDGSMPPKSRNEAVLEFTGNPNCRIMLVSLKAGNAGLNLTAANQVIILDPHWNPFVEMQAADRAYRIGQMRPVEVHRVLVDGQGLKKTDEGTATVEDRILALQDKKRALVENALDENAGESVARLGVRELGYLFGINSM